MESKIINNDPKSNIKFELICSLPLQKIPAKKNHSIFEKKDNNLANVSTPFYILLKCKGSSYRMQQ